MAEGVTQVAMEATGDYWRPAWHILEEVAGLELLLVNPRHVKNVPGRKSAAGDAAWPPPLRGPARRPGVSGSSDASAPSVFSSPTNGMSHW